MRLAIRDILRGRIEEVRAMYDRSTEQPLEFIVENASTCGYYSGKYLKELNYSLFDLVLLNIWFATNMSITICVQSEEIIIIGNTLPKRISLHQQDSIEQTIRIISEVIAIQNWLEI